MATDLMTTEQAAQQSVEQHTPEPWYIAAGDIPDPHDPRYICGGEIGSKVIAAAYDQREANARRIVACVNACAGIPTEELEDGEPGHIAGLALGVAKEGLLHGLEADALAAALREFVDGHPCTDETGSRALGVCATQDRARALLARREPGGGG